jgi:hypothetical protein
MSKPVTFNNLAEAVAAANYVQQLLAAEYQWINNRVSWLFISQSFCISAYVVLQTSTGQRFAESMDITVLERGLPAFGMICSVMVGCAIFAAQRVVNSLTMERQRIVHHINENSPVNIPLAGAEGDLRNQRWIPLVGGMPHRILPWILGFFWLALIFR